MSQPGSASRSRPSRAAAPAVLRVVSERLAPEEAARLAAPGPAGPSTGAEQAGAAVPGLAAAPGPRAAPLTPLRDVTTAATATPGGGRTSSGTVATARWSPPAPAPRRPAPRHPAPRGPWGRLADLVTGRRRTGRHRPDTLHSHGWSMFAPQRRARRWGVRAH